MTKASAASSGSGRMSINSNPFGSILTISRAFLRHEWGRFRRLLHSSQRRGSLSLLQWCLPATVSTYIGPYPVPSDSASGYRLRKASNSYAKKKDFPPITHARLTHLGCCVQWERIIGKMQTTPRPWYGSEEVETHTRLTFSSLAYDSVLWSQQVIAEYHKSLVEASAAKMAAKMDSVICQSIYEKQLKEAARLVNTPMVQVNDPKIPKVYFKSVPPCDLYSPPEVQIKTNQSGVLPSPSSLT